MHQAPRYDPLERSDFFADQRGARPLVEGTVARGFLRDDKVFYTGKQPDGQLVDDDPGDGRQGAAAARARTASTSTARRATARTGDGNGMIVQRGFKQPTSYHTDRLRAQPRRLLLRRDHQRVRRDAGLLGAGGARGSLGDRRLHPHAAVQPPRDRGGRAGRRDAARSTARGRAGRRARHGAGASTHE